MKDAFHFREAHLYTFAPHQLQARHGGISATDRSMAMSESSKPSVKRRAPAFKPPRPASKAKTTPEASSRRKSAPARAAILSISSSDDELVSSPSAQSPEPTTMASIDDPPPTIPPKLLTRLLHHNFKDSEVRIGKEANELVAKYIETFIREAIARATFERSESDGGGLGGEFLEVSPNTRRENPA